MLSSDWPGSISSDKPVCIRGDHSGNTRLHGDRIPLHLVWRTPVVSARHGPGWSGKPYAITTWPAGWWPQSASGRLTICCGNSAPIHFTKGRGRHEHTELNTHIMNIWHDPDHIVRAWCIIIAVVILVRVVAHYHG